MMLVDLVNSSYIPLVAVHQIKFLRIRETRLGFSILRIPWHPVVD